jgi:hypothetical protein
MKPTDCMDIEGSIEGDEPFRQRISSDTKLQYL